MTITLDLPDAVLGAGENMTILRLDVSPGDARFTAAESATTVAAQAACLIRGRDQ